MNNLRPLWLSCNPNAPTGFGRVTFEVGHRLMAAGIDLVHFSLQAFGDPFGMVIPSRHGNKMFQVCGPTRKEIPGEGILEHIRRAMAITNRNALVTLWATWDLDNPLGKLIPCWIPYAPLDAPLTLYERPMYEGVAHVIAMSRFGEREFTKAGLPVTFIPHGVDTAFYCPCDEEEKARARARIGIPVDGFVVGSVGTNYRDRKRFDRMVRIFSEFIRAGDVRDAYLYIHTERKPVAPGMGFDLELLARKYDIADRLLLPASANVCEESLRDIYRSMDVYLSTSAAEGFGIPALEAAACGIATILPDNSAQSELVVNGETGILVPCTDHEIRQTDPCHSRWGIIDADQCRHAIRYAYQDRGSLKRWGIGAREFSLAYDWNRIINEKWLPFLKETEDTRA